MESNSLNNFERGPPKDHFCQVWLESIQWFRRRCNLKLWTDGRRRRRRRRRTVTHTNSSPGAFGSGTEDRNYFSLSGVNKFLISSTCFSQFERNILWNFDKTWTLRAKIVRENIQSLLLCEWLYLKGRVFSWKWSPCIWHPTESNFNDPVSGSNSKIFHGLNLKLKRGLQTEIPRNAEATFSFLFFFPIISDKEIFYGWKSSPTWRCIPQQGTCHQHHHQHYHNHH